jgi:hypothetical protein
LIERLVAYEMGAYAPRRGDDWYLWGLL